MRAVVITVNGAIARGEAVDESGPALVAALRGAGLDVGEPLLVADRAVDVEAALKQAVWTNPELVVTVGGTGLTTRDVTPDVTAKVVDRLVPGLAEAIRSAHGREDVRAVLGRGLAGTAGSCLVVNLPGGPRAVAAGLDVLLPLLPHVATQLQAHER